MLIIYYNDKFRFVDMRFQSNNRFISNNVSANPLVYFGKTKQLGHGSWPSILHGIMEYKLETW